MADHQEHLQFHLIALDAARIGAGFLLLLMAVEAGMPGAVARFFNIHALLLWTAGASLLAFFTKGKKARAAAEEGGSSLWLVTFGSVVALHVWTTFTTVRPSMRAVVMAAAVLTCMLASRTFSKER